jgi:hypothetical protein
VKLVLEMAWMRDLVSAKNLVLLRREVDRPYPRVPVVGESIYLDDAGSIDHEVKQVVWGNDGVGYLWVGERTLEQHGEASLGDLYDAGFIEVQSFEEEDADEGFEARWGEIVRDLTEQGPDEGDSDGEDGRGTAPEEPE